MNISPAVAALLETTTTGSMGAVDLPLRRRMARRRKIKEGEVDNKPVIPDEAKSYRTGQQAVNTPATPEQQGLEAEKDDEVYLDTALALVAPDTTPNADSPLDPAQVPGGAPAQTTSSPETGSPGSPLRTLLGIHQQAVPKDSPAIEQVDPLKDPNAVKTESVSPAAFAASLGITESGEPAAAVGTASAGVMASLMSAKPMPPPTVNPDATQKACSAMRLFRGD